MGNIYTNDKDLNNKYQKDIDDIIKSFRFQNIYNSIEDVYTLGRYDITPIRFFKSLVPTILNNKIKINSDFSDIIFGFYSTKEIEIKILYKNNEIMQQKIPYNLICLPQSNFIPICCLEKDDIELEITTYYEEFYIIYGIFSYDIRTYLMNNIIYTKIFNGKKEEELMYFNKKLYIDKQVPEDNVNIIKLPLIYIETEIYRKYIANKITEHIREELLKNTMHPDRLNSFMSIDELKKYNLY